MIHYSFAYVHANLAKVLDKVLDDAEIVIIERDEHERVALVSADELERMQVKLDFLSSPEYLRLIKVPTEQRVARD